jgi:hypothetical protein
MSVLRVDETMMEQNERVGPEDRGASRSKWSAMVASQCHSEAHESQTETERQNVAQQQQQQQP